MYCKKCGNFVPNNAGRCDFCGAPVGGLFSDPVGKRREPKPQVGIVEAIRLYFVGYTDFHGRSRRSEYWWATLVIGLAGGIVGAVLPDYSWIWTLATLVPSLALCIRRLHDVGKSGWWYLFILLPIVGTIILLVQFCKDSQPEENPWGPSPKY